MPEHLAKDRLIWIYAQFASASLKTASSGLSSSTPEQFAGTPISQMALKRQSWELWQPAMTTILR